MDFHLTRMWTPSKMRMLQAVMLAARKFSSILFICWTREPRPTQVVYRAPGTPDGKTMRESVLQCIIDGAVATFNHVYIKDAHVTISFDRWKSRGDRKLMVKKSSYGGRDRPRPTESPSS